VRIAASQGSDRTSACIPTRPVSHELAPGNPVIRGVADLTQESLGIYLGRITAEATGLYNQEPGVLLEIAIEDRAEDSLFPGQGFFYLFYPQGEVPLRGHVYCVENSELPPLPKIGDAVVVAPVLPPIDPESRVLYPYFQEAFLSGIDGKPVLPLRRKKTELVNFQSLDLLFEALVRWEGQR
jgi:hypothetical protein